jgi:NTP pyrophosphatase (non-canonical NTP hydrolase)
MPMSLNEVSKRHHVWLKEMGWVGVTTPLEQLALVTSEVGEAINECRGNQPTENLKYELADIILRVLGLAENQSIDMEKAIEEKISKNIERGNRGRVK